jgi:Carboxypeptidase regulatory-like domain
VSRIFHKLTWFALLFFAGYALAQSTPGTLRGKVTDPTGAVIPNASVTATNSSGQKSTAVTDNRGVYEIKGLAPGSYTVTTSASGFAQSTEQNVTISPGQVQQFDIGLEIEVQKEKLEVQDENVTVNTSASDNASSIVIKGKDLDALPDDPDELQEDLQALAGPSAGPNGGQIYIDGFTGGQLPPKSSIREIRINQNPFSSEYDKLGYGRIEIFTKPGTDQYHGEFFLDGNDSAFNSLNPFTPDVPAYNSELFHASVSGPLRKKASFFFNVEGRHINDSNLVNATVLDPDFAQTQLIQAVPNPRTRLNVGPRVDYQISKNNTLTVRYQYFHDTEDNEGVGQFSLPSQEYNSREDEHTVQITDTQVVSNNVINETRFQFNRDDTRQIVQNAPGGIIPPTLSVLGAFTGGGNQIGNPIDHENRYEFQNYTSVLHHTHFIKFGARLRGTTDSSSSNANFNGVFTFPSIGVWAACDQILAAHGVCQGATAPSQFSQTIGQPLVNVGVVDAGLYVQDDWRVRPNFTLSYGLRFETQNQIHDHGDWAPRVSFAWGLGRSNNPSPKTVLRAGFGIFYDRFSYNLVEQAERLNGITQKQFILTNPSIDSVTAAPALNAAPQTSPTIYQISPTLRAPMTMQSALSIERQVTKSATLAITYLNSIGEHQFFLRNINAPLPGTYTGPGTGVRPLGGTDNIYQYDSEGVFRQNQLIANVRINASSRVSLFGYYTLNYANSDLGSGASSGGGAGFFSGGATSTPNFLTNQYDPMADYGRAQFDVRHRVFLGGTISMPYQFRLNPFLLVASGTPYDITLGQDLNGDSIFNDRPALVSSIACPKVGPAPGQPSSILCTPLGTFNVLPVAGQTLVPVNSATGPTLFTLNLRLSKTFGFGRETKGGGSGGGPNYGGRHGGGGPGGGLGPGGLSSAGGGRGGGIFGGGATTGRRYNLTFSVSARNVLNRVNFGVPIGELTSPLFAQSNSLAQGAFSSQGAVRRIDLQVLFSF